MLYTPAIILQIEEKDILQADERLHRLVRFDFKSSRIDLFCNSLSPVVNIRLSADPELSGMRVTLISPRLPLYKAMSLVATILDASWIKDGEDGYRLVFSEEQKERWQTKIKASEKRERLFFQQRTIRAREQIIAEIQKAVHNPQSMGGMLASLTAQEVDQFIEIINLPRGAVSATDNSNLHEKLFMARDFSQWPESTQQWLKKSVAALTAGPMKVSEDVLKKSKVGLVGAHQCIAVGFLLPGQSDIQTISGKETILEISDFDDMLINDGDPTVQVKLSSPTLVDISALPKEMRNMPLSLSTNQKTIYYLSEVLSEISKKANINIIADDYWRNRSTHMDPFSGRNQMTLKDALQQIAITFRHKMTYRKGALHVETVTPGLDRRSDPDPQLLLQLEKLYEEKKPITEAEYRLGGKMSRIQAITFAATPPTKQPRTLLLANLQWRHSLLSFYSSLTEEQLEKAISPDGIERKDLDDKQKKLFDINCRIGFPLKPEETLQKERFYLKKTSDKSGYTTHLTFYFIGKNSETLSRAYTLKI